MSHSNSATAESKNLVFSCFKLQEVSCGSFTARLEVVNLAKELEANVLKFSVIDCFDMSHDTLFRILATTLTYVIILIEHNDTI